MDYSICITTFSERYNQLEKLISEIRSFTNQEILICVNGNYGVDFDEEYRRKVIELSLLHEKIYPIFFPEQRGLAKLWNTLVIHSPNDWCLLLSEDVSIKTNSFFETLSSKLPDSPDLKIINGSFAHFVVHKKILYELGYFDERLLGFGHEDGDMIFRYIEKYDKWIEDYRINGIEHHNSDVIDKNIKLQLGCHKYSFFNKLFLFERESPKYVSDVNGVKSSFGYSAIRVLKEDNQYPYEQFFLENKNML